MGGLRFADLQTRPTEALDVTRLTVAALPQLVPSCEATCQAPMTAWRLDRQPRTARRYPTDPHCPLPAPEARRLCSLVSLKTSPLPVVQGQLVGRGQRNAQPWIHPL